MSDAGWFLTTERLGFRTWQREDGALAVALWSDPGVARYLQATGAGDATAAAAEARLLRELALQASFGVQYWPIFLRADGAHVGCCGLRPYAAGVHELGVHLRPAYWGRGLAVEAAQAAIDHAFGALGCAALFAGHHPENRASQKLLARLGFAYTHDELYPPTGLYHLSYRLERK